MFINKTGYDFSQFVDSWMTIYTISTLHRILGHQPRVKCPVIATKFPNTTLLVVGVLHDVVSTPSHDCQLMTFLSTRYDTTTKKWLCIGCHEAYVTHQYTDWME